MEPTGGYSSYFAGRDEKTWFTGIPHYARIRYSDVYPGVDMVYYGSGRNIEYDFIVKPGGHPEQIELAFSQPVKMDDGDLIVAGLRQRRPKVVQNGREVAAEYRIAGDGHVRLALSNYDPSYELTIDPVLEFSTYIGGPGEDSFDSVTTDANGFIYVAGGTQSSATPGLDPFQQTNLVGLAPIIMKFTPDGQKVLFYATLGANGWDIATSIGLDSTGNIVVVGSTRSANFPLKNAIQTQLLAAIDTIFVSKLAADGRTLLFSTYFGGSERDYAGRVVLDDQDNAYFEGATYSRDFPTQNAYQAVYGGGQDCYLFKLSPAGSLVFSTYFGGSGLDVCGGIARDPQGNILIGGGSTGDLPLKNALQSETTPRTGYLTPMLAKFSSDGVLLTSTYFGGPASGQVESVAVDASGNTYIAGDTDDRQFVTINGFQSSYPGSASGFFAKLKPPAFGGGILELHREFDRRKRCRGYLRRSQWVRLPRGEYRGTGFSAEGFSAKLEGWGHHQHRCVRYEN